MPPWTKCSRKVARFLRSLVLVMVTSLDWVWASLVVTRADAVAPSLRPCLNAATTVRVSPILGRMNPSDLA